MRTKYLNLGTLPVLLTLLSFFVSGCKNSPTEPSGSLGQYKIAFVSLRTDTLGQDDTQIYITNSDGSNLTRLTNDLRYSVYPEWSPDGGRIVFVRGHGDAIYVMNSDGTNQSRLVDSVGDDWDERPIWSPDGGRIAFVDSRGVFPQVPVSGIYVINPDGSNRQLLGDGGSPVWSTDGTKIAFLSGSPAQVFVMNADGTNQLQVTRDPTSKGYPSWSPNGAKIAFAVSSGGSYEIHTINVDGTTDTRLTNIEGSHIRAQWSPDGTKILLGVRELREFRELASRIYTINANGTNQQLLADSASFPSWSPDGTKVIFFSAAVDYGLYVMNPDGTNRKRLTSAFDIYPTWSPVRFP